MKTSLAIHDLTTYLARQLDCFYPDQIEVLASITAIMPRVAQRLEYCFSHIEKKYYFESGEAVFNHLNSDHYAMFLYIASNEAYLQNAINLAEKLFLLNKALHAIDAFYAIKLPEIFLFVHPVGAVLGNASYGNYFVLYQNVTVGSDLAGIYPSFGEGVVLYEKSTIIGNCKLGDNVAVGSNSFIRNIQVENNSTVVGVYPNARVLPNKRNNRIDFFQSSLKNSA